MKMGKREKKRKRNSWLSGLGGFRPSRARGRAGPGDPRSRERRDGCEDDVVGMGPPASEGERNGVTGGGGPPAGRNRPLVISVAVHRRWSGSGWSCHTRALRNKVRCISYMRQEDNIYNNRVYRYKCHNNIRVFIT
jgi:hypothetical protein